MMKLMKSRLKGKMLCTLAAVSLSFGGLVQADEWPEDNIRLVVPALQWQLASWHAVGADQTICC